MGAQSDHESGFFEGDECADDDEVEIIHEEINNPGAMLKQQPQKGKSQSLLCFVVQIGLTRLGV